VSSSGWATEPAGAAPDRAPTCRPVRSTYVGLFLTTLSLLQLELFLTRIFSVTMWYHFAFMAISLGMFGLAAGAVYVELAKKRNPHLSLERAALAFAASSVACFAAELQLRVDPERNLLATALAFTLVAVPFVFAGIVICIALTQFPGCAGRLYAADLAGSAAGCLLAIPFLNNVHAPSAVILNAGLAMLAAAAFGRTRRRYAAAGAAALGVFAYFNASAKLVDVRWIKGGAYAGDALYEKWNALSRIAVGRFETTPFGWGMSPVYKSSAPLDQLYLNIDSGAATVITRFNGELRAVDHLKYDVTALAHHLRTNASVFVVGVGGGRDILTSLAFGQKRIVGVEINPAIIEALTSRFADYAGNLHRHPSVTLAHGEARSVIEQSRETFDIIQASLIDTWAASSAGAYVLTENGLYTKEAWEAFLNHLTPDGILTMSRWYHEAQPAETLRLASLATAALMELGVEDPRRHMMIVRKQDDSETGQYGVATILVCRRPFTEAETDRIVSVSRALQFRPVLTPAFAELPEFEAVATPGRYERLVATYPLNIEAPTDDTPFFFHMLRASDLLKPSTYQGMNEINLKAVRILATLLGIVVALSAAAIVAPMMLSRVRRAASPRLIVYFAAIGLAFMMVEIGQLERLIVFLGHPIYGLTVVLFTLLVASSLGSLKSEKWGRWLWALPLALAAFILISPPISRAFAGSSAPVRIAVSAALLFPCGFLMGMAFPAGIKAASRNSSSPQAWYWAINGAFSVVASVLALTVAVFWGVTATLITGLTCYLVALLALAVEQRRDAAGRKDPLPPSAALPLEGGEKALLGKRLLPL